MGRLLLNKKFWICFSHVWGVYNAYMACLNIDKGRYLLALISAICVLLMAATNTNVRKWKDD